LTKFNFVEAYRHTQREYN